MISFCNKKVYKLYEADLANTHLYSHFCKPGHSSDIILVYDCNNHFVGTITYERLLYNKDELIQKCYLVVASDIIDRAKELFQQENKLIYIPVFNENMDLISFCYCSHIHSEKIYFNIIKDLFANDDLLFISELYPQVQSVVIHNLNELAYEFYKLLQKRGIPSIVIGSEWSDILGIASDDVVTSTYSRMEVYSEGTPLIRKDKSIHDKHRFETPDSWHFIKEIALANRIVIENIYKKDFRLSNRNLSICRVPMFEELKKHTLDECFRHDKYICLRNSDLDLDNDLVQEQISKIYNTNYEDVLNQFDLDAELDRIKKFAYGTNIRQYGTGQKKIYLIGPCIVEGYYLQKEDELLTHLWQTVSEIYEDTYSIIAISISELQMSELFTTMNSLHITDDDMVVFVGQSHEQLCKNYGIRDSIDLNLLDLFNRRPQNETWFMDVPVHTTGIANKAIANELLSHFIEPEIAATTISLRTA